MQLTPYDRDLIKQFFACDRDLSQLAYERWLRHEQVFAW